MSRDYTGSADLLFLFEEVVNDFGLKFKGGGFGFIGEIGV